MGRYGHNALEGFEFIKNGKELLVQHEPAKGGKGPYIFLKMEGHKTDKKASKAEKAAHKEAWKKRI
ncbi:MAG: hypothetical protein GY768_14680 [Planctomycetaceae bacterium]|nr:hypothetical protein [Planctomycetaceae bacterium]